MKTSLKIVAASTLAAILFSIGCNKLDDVEQTGANLIFAFDILVNGEDFETGTVYDINGTAVSFDIVSYYVGGLVLKQGEAEISLQNNYLLASPGFRAGLNGTIAPVNITGVDFFIGVDSITNGQAEVDFIDRPSSDPLGLQDPDMHWNWNTGYKFLRVDGDADTDGDGIVDTGIAYHLGSDPLLKNFSFSTDIPLQVGENTLSFVLDLGSFFEGVDLSTELDTHTGNNLPLAQRLHDNLSTAVTVN